MRTIFAWSPLPVQAGEVFLSVPVTDATIATEIPMSFGGRFGQIIDLAANRRALGTQHATGGCIPLAVCVRPGNAPTHIGLAHLAYGGPEEAGAFGQTIGALAVLASQVFLVILDYVSTVQNHMANQNNYQPSGGIALMVNAFHGGLGAILPQHNVTCLAGSSGKLAITPSGYFGELIENL